MKRIKIFASIAIVAAALTTTSCKDWLQLAPEDYYGSEGYWKNEAHATGYIDGIHSHLRGLYFLHIDQFGDLRGGLWKSGVSIDGTALSYGDIINCNFDEDHTLTTKFGDMYGRIFNCNLFIKKVEEDPDYPIAADLKNYYLGIVHGIRAFYYYDIYRNYGTAPLRLGTEVADGILDPNLLNMERAAASAVAAQIEADLEASLKFFGNFTQFNPFGVDGTNQKHYWSKAATEALAADFYLWQAKVTTGDHTATGANGADLTKAEQYLKSLETNYGLSMQKDFKNVFSTSNKGNSEVIFALYFDENEATNNRNIWTPQTNAEIVSTGYDFRGNKITSGSLTEDFKSFTRLDIEYKVELLKHFDAEDSRYLATFYPVSRMNAAGELELTGSVVWKNIGHISSTSGTRTFDGDLILYRLPWVYLSLAEVANMKGDAATVKKYVDLVRERAYGENWDASKYGFTTGDFKTNELGILMEKTKEFVQEGQRWYDLRRMKTSAAGGPETALVFSADAAIENGVVAADFELLPQLDYATEAHKVLLPIDKDLLGKETALEQTPGYK